MSHTQIIPNDIFKNQLSFWEDVFKEGNVLSFYYKSPHSTDNSLLTVFPVALLGTGADRKVFALKFINNRFEVRFYNLNGISNLSVGEPFDVNNIDKKDPNEMYSYKSSSYLITSIDWNDLVKKQEQKDKKEQKPEVPKNAVWLKLPTSDELFLDVGVDEELWILNMTKKSVIMQDWTSNLDVVDQIFEKIEVPRKLKMDNVYSGQVLKFNAIEGSRWNKLKVSVVAALEDQDVVEVALVDKNKELISFLVPVAALKLVEEECECDSGCGDCDNYSSDSVSKCVAGAEHNKSHQNQQPTVSPEILAKVVASKKKFNEKDWE